jgi:hypothetical protein
MTESGWNNIKKVAEQFRNKPVLYCVMFKHGMMKIGSTSNILKRLKSFSVHGVFASFFDKVVIESCEGHILLEAEKIANKEIAKISQRLNTEVFGIIDIDTVRDVFIKSISKSSQSSCKPITKDDYHKVAITSNLYGVFASIVYNRNSEIYKKEAVDFVLSNTPENGYINDVEWFDALYKLHPFTINLINKICIDNAMLIYFGVGRADRKSALSKFIAGYNKPTMNEGGISI